MEASVCGSKTVRATCKVAFAAATGIVGVFIAFGCFADTLYLPVGVTTNVDVAADAALADTVSLADRTAVVKGGAGKLTVPSGKFIQDKTVDIRVREGSVALTATQQELAAYPEPTETMNKAAFWLESRTNLVKDGDDIKVWRDVRDTDSSVTNHYYAVVDNTWTNLCPQEATYKEKDAVYFRGYQSGCWMNWQKPTGGQATVGNLYHVFLVHGASSYWGYALGQRKGQSPYFHPGEPGGGANAVMWIAHNNETKPMHASRSFRDGVEVDAFTTSQGTGIHVVEVDCLEMRQSAQCFFNDRDFWDDGSGHNPMFGPDSTTQIEGGKRSGGEYICEMLLFTNRLSEVERVSISNWLLRKWRDAVPPQKVPVAVALATNTVVEVETGAYSSLAVSGDGTLANVGQDALVMLSHAQPVQRTVHLSAGASPIMLGHPMPVECAAGDTVNSAITYAGPKLTKTASAGEGKLVKTGNGLLLIDKIPEGVTELTVTGGLLMLSDPDRHADLVPGPDMNVAATIPEWSFETYNASSASNCQKYFNNSEYEGWHGIKPVPDDGYSQVFIFDSQYGSPTGWGLTVDPPDGKNCLAVKHYASAWREFTVPETGKYELEFWAAPRNGYSGKHLDVMIGTSESDLVRLGDIQTSDFQGWRRYVYRIGLLEVGTTYQLWFKTKGENSSRNDCLTQIDAVRVKLSEAVIGTWAIPNGDFEDHAVGFSNSFTLDNTNRVTGFTVEQHTGAAAAESGTANYTTFSAYGTDNFARYNRPWSTGGTTQFYMTGTGSKLVTTFTPPAGRWHVQADMSAWCVSSSTAGKAYAVDAEVTIGGVTTSLGQISTNEHRLAARKWPTAFVVDGETPVTLTLAGVVPNSWGHGILDNLVLVAAPATDENLLADPGIDDSSKWSIVKTPKPSGVTASQFMNCDSFYKQHFGLDSLAGTKVAKIVNDDTIYQSVTFPTGGLYRLTVNLKTRGTTVPSNSGNNPVDVYLAKDGVTNIVGRSDNAATTNYNEYAFTFAVPEVGGTYDVGFHGTSVWGGDGTPTVDRTMLLDAAWLCRVESEHELVLPKDLNIEVAEGARLQLDFAGTNEVFSLRIAGRKCSGYISAETRPDLFPALSGPGTLYIRDRGLLIVVR
jgi:hypothetical protein